MCQREGSLELACGFGGGGKGPHRGNSKCEDPEAREIGVHLQDRKETSVVPVQGANLGRQDWRGGTKQGSLEDSQED